MERRILRFGLCPCNTGTTPTTHIYSAQRQLVRETSDYSLEAFSSNRALWQSVMILKTMKSTAPYIKVRSNSRCNVKFPPYIKPYLTKFPLAKFHFLLKSSVARRFHSCNNMLITVWLKKWHDHRACHALLKIDIICMCHDFVCMFNNNVLLDGRIQPIYLQEPSGYGMK